MPFCLFSVPACPSSTANKQKQQPKTDGLRVETNFILIPSTTAEPEVLDWWLIGYSEKQWL